MDKNICLNCSCKKMCKPYDFIQGYSQEIVFNVVSCIYFKPYLQSTKTSVIKDYNSISNQIKELSKIHTSDAPQTTAALKGTGLQLTVDDNEIN